jgi:hypothetical protein
MIKRRFWLFSRRWWKECLYIIAMAIGTMGEQMKQLEFGWCRMNWLDNFQVNLKMKRKQQGKKKILLFSRRWWKRYWSEVMLIVGLIVGITLMIIGWAK